MLKRLLTFFKGADAPTEADSPRDGAFSYAAEFHAFSLGFYDGMKTWRFRPKELPKIPDVQKEPWYYKGGYVIGTLLQLGIVIIVAEYTGMVPF